MCRILFHVLPLVALVIAALLNGAVVWLRKEPIWMVNAHLGHSSAHRLIQNWIFLPLARHLEKRPYELASLLLVGDAPGLDKVLPRGKRPGPMLVEHRFH